MKTIFVVEDDHLLNKTLVYNLSEEGYEVTSVFNARAAADMLRRSAYDLVLLDINLPDGDGYDLCRLVRLQNPDTIVIFLTANDQECDQMKGYDAGAVDYITKPFLPLELIARVNALFRRAALQNPASEKELSNQYTCGNLELYRMERKVLVGKEEFSVTPAEFEFLLYLIEREDMAVSKEELTECLQECKWMKEEQRMSDDLVKRLRKKLKTKGATARVETVWGYGYRLTAKSI